MPENGYNQWCMKSSKLYILIILLTALLSGTLLLNSNVPETGSTEPAVTETAETEPETDETDGTDRKETEEDQEKPEKLVYEAVFLDSEGRRNIQNHSEGTARLDLPQEANALAVHKVGQHSTVIQ